MSQVVSALAHCKPIITPAWMEDVVKCLAARKPLPCTSHYLPPLVDGNLGSVDVSFHPDYKRRKLFSDKTVYFLSERQVHNIYCLFYYCVMLADWRANCLMGGVGKKGLHCYAWRTFVSFYLCNLFTFTCKRYEWVPHMKYNGLMKNENGCHGKDQENGFRF